MRNISGNMKKTFGLFSIRILEILNWLYGI